MKLKKLTTIFLAVLCAMLLITPVFAAGDVIIDYNGACNPGGIQGSGGTVSSGYLIPSVTNNIDLIYGFRFSIYDGDGNKKYKLDEYGDPVSSSTIDVFVKENKVNGRYYSGLVLPCSDTGVPTVSAQLSKKEWLTTYYGSDVTPVPNGTGRNSRQNANCGFETLLPAEVCKEVLA